MCGRTGQEELLAGKNILYKKQMGTITEYDIYDVITLAEKKELDVPFPFAGRRIVKKNGIWQSGWWQESV